MTRYQVSAARRAGAATVVLLLGASGLSAALATRAPAALAPIEAARTARTASVNDTGHLRLLNASGEARGGSIVGHGSAVLHSSREFSSFGGSLSVDRGTGRYAHASGTGKLYGVIDRSNDALIVQTVGQLHY